MSNPKSKFSKTGYSSTRKHASTASTTKKNINEK